MKGFAAFTILSGAFIVLGWSYIAQPLNVDNPKAFEKCIKLHPQRYCTIAYLPTKISTMEAK